MKAPKTAAPKSVAPKATTPKAVTPKVEPELRILKIASCPSLSGKSTLTYHVGCTEKSEIKIRVYANSGTGFFSKEWVALNTIQQAFAKVPMEKAITSFILFPLYRGKSINTPAFLFAALMNEGLVRPVEGTRSYASTDPNGFIAEVKALIASTVSLKADDKPAKAKPQSVQAKADDAPQSIEAKPSKLAEKPLKAEPKQAKVADKPTKLAVKPKPAAVEKKPAAPSKKAASKATPKRHAPR